MTIIIQNKPVDDPVYQFLNKKRSEGKPYRVYMIAAAHKFLRIYYARVMQALNWSLNKYFLIRLLQKKDFDAVF